MQNLDYKFRLQIFRCQYSATFTTIFINIFSGELILKNAANERMRRTELKSSKEVILIYLTIHSFVSQLVSYLLIHFTFF